MDERRRVGRGSRLRARPTTRVAQLQSQLISITSQSAATYLERVCSASDCRNRKRATSSSESCLGLSILLSAQLLADRPVRHLRLRLDRIRPVYAATAAMAAASRSLHGRTFGACQGRRRLCRSYRPGRHSARHHACVRSSFNNPPPLQRGPPLLPADLCFCWGGKSPRSRKLLVSRIARPPSPYLPTGSMTSRQLSA